MSFTAPGWYPDPTNSEQLRYWDGGAWTLHVAGVKGELASVKPLGTSLVHAEVLAPERAQAIVPSAEHGRMPRRAIGGLIAIAATMAVVVGVGSTIINTWYETRSAEVAAEHDKLYADFPSDEAVMTASMRAGDRAAFVSAGDGIAVDQLGKLWDETQKIGWTTGVAVGGVSVDGDIYSDQSILTFGFDLGFTLLDTTDPESDSSELMLQGFDYVVTWGEMADLPNGEARGRLITSIEPVIPMPWDSSEGVYAARTAHSVLFGVASDQALIDARSEQSERAASFVLDTLSPDFFTDQISGFVAYAPSDETVYQELASTGSDIESLGVMMPTARTWTDGVSFTSAPLVAVSPAEGSDVAETLAHEYTHFAQRVTVRESMMSNPAGSRSAFVEGHATYVQHLFAGTTEEFVNDTVQSAIEGDLGQLLRDNGGFADADQRATAYLVAGAYMDFYVNTGGDLSTFVRDGVANAWAETVGPPMIQGHPHDIDSWKVWLAAQ